VGKKKRPVLVEKEKSRKCGGKEELYELRNGEK